MKAKWFCEKVKKQLKTFSLWTFYRVSHRKLVFLNKLGEIETWKLDFFGRWFWNPEIWEILLVQPVFMKSILCAIYGPICKLAKKILGKKILNVTTVKLLLKNKNQCFWNFLMPSCFKLFLKVNIHPFHVFFYTLLLEIGL